MTSYTPSPPCWEPHSPLDWRQVARDKGMVWVGGAKGREGTEVGGIQAVGFGRSGCVRLGPGHLSCSLSWTLRIVTLGADGLGTRWDSLGEAGPVIQVCQF